MAGVGNLVAYLGLDSRRFSSGITDAQSSMRSFANRTSETMAAIVPQLDRVSVAAAGIGTAGSVAATGLSAIGLVVPQVQSAATAMSAISRAGFTASQAAEGTSMALIRAGRNATVVQRISVALGNIGGSAALARLGLMGVSFAMARMGRDTSRIDGVSRVLGRVAVAAIGARIAIFGISTAASAVRASVVLPFRAAEMALRGVAAAASAAKSAIASAAAGMSQFKMSVTSLGLPSLAVGLGGAGAAGAFGLLAGSSVQLASELEQTSIAFEVMLGSAAAATKMLSEMRSLAEKSPLELRDVQKAGRTLLQFGLSAENTMPVLAMLSDVSSGNAERFRALSLAFGQMSAAGRLMGQDLLQMINAGFNPLQEISRTTGVSMGELKKQMEDGGISAQMVADAFRSATSEGGRFFGMSDRQSKTLQGQMSKLSDAVSMAMTEIGTSIIRSFDLTSIVRETESLVTVFRTDFAPKINESLASVGGASKRVITEMRGEWGEWFTGTLASLSDFVSNFDLYFAVAQQNVVLWASNSINIVSNFFTNAGELLTWFGDNWRDILYTAGDAATTVFMNVGENLKSLWDGILSYIQGNGFEFNPTPLLDGFKSTIKEMPKLSEAAVAETLPELESLYKELARRQSEVAATVANAAIEASAETATSGPVSLAGSTMDGKKKSAADTAVAALQASSTDAVGALGRIFNASRGGKVDPQVKATKDVEKAVKAQTEAVVEAVRGGTGPMLLASIYP